MQLLQLKSNKIACDFLPFSDQFGVAGGLLLVGLLFQSEYLEHVPCEGNHCFYFEFANIFSPGFCRVTLLMIAEETNPFRHS